MQSNVMEMNGSARHRSPLPPPPTTVHLINGNGTIEQWSKLADSTNGHQDQVKSIFIESQKFSECQSTKRDFIFLFTVKFESNAKSKR